jgi:hypothetical protein
MVRGDVATHNVSAREIQVGYAACNIIYIPDEEGNYTALCVL